MYKKFMPFSKFFIPNQFEIPNEKNVAELMTDGETCRYIHKDKRRYPPMPLKDAIPIEEFGLVVLKESENSRLFRHQFKRKTFRYKDGSEKGWEGKQYFELNLWCHRRDEIDEIFVFNRKRK